MTKTTKNQPALSALTPKLEAARAELSKLIAAEQQVLQAAMAAVQNGTRTSEVEQFRSEQLGLLREPLATARAQVADLQGQVDAIQRGEAATKTKARHSDIEATIEADRKEVERCKAELKRLQDKRSELDLQLIDARGQRLKLAEDTEGLIREQGLALAEGGSFDDAKVKAIRSEAAALADRVKAYEIGVQDLDSKIKAAKDDVTNADRNLTEMLSVKRTQDDQKTLHKAVKAIGSPDELARIVVDAIAAGGLPKPNNAWKLDQSHLMRVGA
jgi:outer membrane murein-binding lipoprotein Lpp